jgi:hypothetical protein
MDYHIYSENPFYQFDHVHLDRNPYSVGNLHGERAVLPAQTLFL